MWLGEHTLTANNRKCWKLATRNTSPSAAAASPLSPLAVKRVPASEPLCCSSQPSPWFPSLLITPSVSLPWSALDVSWRADLAVDEHDFLWSESQLVKLVVRRELIRGQIRRWAPGTEREDSEVRWAGLRSAFALSPSPSMPESTTTTTELPLLLQPHLFHCAAKFKRRCFYFTASNHPQLNILEQWNTIKEWWNINKKCPLPRRTKGKLLLLHYLVWGKTFNQRRTSTVFFKCLNKLNKQSLFVFMIE